MPRQVSRETFAFIADKLQLPLVRAIYGFGSYFRGDEKPEDVDILIVFHDAAAAAFKEAILQAASYADMVAPEIGEQPHMSRLTEKECAQTNFINEVGAEQLWPMRPVAAC